MNKSICKICGKSFSHKRQGLFICSKQCKTENKAILNRTAKSVKKRKGRTGIDLTLGNETDEETSLPPSEPKVLRIRNSQQGATDIDLLVFPV